MRLTALRQNLVAACVVFGGLTASWSPASADTVLNPKQFEKQIGARQSSFLARDLRTGQTCMLGGSDLTTRHAPWSTFKIPNTLIALKTGVSANIEDWRDWDRSRRPAKHFWPESWRQGQTLKSAFQLSAVWYYQDLALEVDGATYRAVLGDWGYGNAVAPDGSDTFWLGGPLKISVTEQVDFLTRMVVGDLGLRDDHLADLFAAAHAGSLGGMMLYGKTGAGPVQEQSFTGAFEGWYVGWLMEHGAVTSVFAHHATGPYFDAIRSYRQEFAETLLAACNLADLPQ